MRDDHRPHAEGNQVPNLAGCASITILGTKIRLLCPSKEASEQLGIKFDVPARLAFVRQIALHGIGNKEIFTQRSFAVGRNETGLLVVVTISLLTTKEAWRGGWFVSLVPIGEEGLFSEYLSQARESVVAGLRAERTRCQVEKGGSQHG